MLISFVHIRVCLRRHNTQTSTNVESNDPKVEFLFEMQWVYNCLFTLDGDVFTACKRGMEQGNVFTPVCHSVHRGWGWLPSMHRRSHDQGVCLQWGLHPQGGLHPRRGWVHQPKHFGIRSTSRRYASTGMHSCLGFFLPTLLSEPVQ